MTQLVKNLSGMQETQVRSLGKIPFAILVWRIHGQRSLVGYSTWGRKESDTTE